MGSGALNWNVLWLVLPALVGAMYLAFAFIADTRAERHAWVSAWVWCWAAVSIPFIAYLVAGNS